MTRQLSFVNSNGATVEAHVSYLPNEAYDVKVDGKTIRCKGALNSSNGTDLIVDLREEDEGQESGRYDSSLLSGLSRWADVAQNHAVYCGGERRRAEHLRR